MPQYELQPLLAFDRQNVAEHVAEAAEAAGVPEDPSR